MSAAARGPRVAGAAGRALRGVPRPARLAALRRRLPRQPPVLGDRGRARRLAHPADRRSFQQIHLSLATFLARLPGGQLENILGYGPDEEFPTAYFVPDEPRFLSVA